MVKFLDSAGLSYLWGKIVEALSGKLDLSADARIVYITTWYAKSADKPVYSLFELGKAYVAEEDKLYVQEITYAGDGRVTMSWVEEPLNGRVLYSYGGRLYYHRDKGVAAAAGESSGELVELALSADVSCLVTLVSSLVASVAKYSHDENAYKIAVTKQDGTVGYVDIPVATREKSGLMSAADKEKLYSAVSASDVLTTFEAGTAGVMSVQEALDALRVSPEYVLPTLEISVTESMEVGSVVATPTVTFRKGDYMPMVNLTLGCTVTTEQSPAPYAMLDTCELQASDVDVNAEVMEEPLSVVGDGYLLSSVTLGAEVDCTGMLPVAKRNNYGVEDTRLAATVGVVRSAAVTVTPYRNWFYGTGTDQTDITDIGGGTGGIKSSMVRSKTVGGHSAGVVGSWDVPATAAYAFVAVPTGTKVRVTELGGDITDSFTVGTATVAGANGQSAVTYDVYYLLSSNATFGAGATFAITVSDYKSLI